MYRRHFRPIHLACLLVILLVSNSCVHFLHSVMGLSAEEAEMLVIRNDSKQVVYIPMHHIGKEAFFDDVSFKVDSFARDGYLILYEGVKSKGRDSLHTVETKRKVRKIIGATIPEEGYVHAIDEMGGSEIVDGLVDQPPAYGLNIDTATAIRADLSLAEMVEGFEAENGEIELDSCDYHTPLDTFTYECDPLDEAMKRKFSKNYISGARNQKIAKIISEADTSKILVIYGAHHFKGMVQELQQIDPAWKVE